MMTNTNILNPALEPLSVFIGKWKTEGTHPMLEGMTLHGETEFSWADNGAFIKLSSFNDEGKIPAGITYIGSDNTNGTLVMIYFDERKVSRILNASFKDNVLKWWRTGPEFSQRYTYTISPDGNTIISKGEMSKDGISWDKDLDQIYTRIK
jgi:hypothetical protein